MAGRGFTWGFSARNEEATAKKKAKPSAKKRAAKRKGVQTEQPKRKVKRDNNGNIIG